MAGHADQKTHKLVLVIAEQLAGLSIGETEFVLSGVRALIGNSTQFDPTAPLFVETVREYNARFGDDHPIPKTQ